MICILQILRKKSGKIGKISLENWEKSGKINPRKKWRSWKIVPISAYNYFYMIEIIRAVRFIIPAMEVTFLSLHMYLYSKGSPKLS